MTTTRKGIKYMLKKTLLVTLAMTLPVIGQAAFMDADWGKSACDAWNGSDTITTGLGGDAFVANDGDRGFKMIQIYRTACGEGSKIQLNIVNKDGKAHCAYGGAPDGKAFDKKHDYVMHASDKNWDCMGSGKFGCGAMGAMSTGKLKFTGPKAEAMGIMGPFNAFLKLTGTLGGDKPACN